MDVIEGFAVICANVVEDRRGFQNYDCEGMCMTRFSFVLTCFVCMSCFCMADISETDKQKIKTVLSGLDDSRMRLNSGVCRIVGNSERGAPEVMNDNILVAFNYNRGFYRFDQGANRTLRTPDYYYECVKDRQMVTRQVATEWSPSWGIRPFDIRALGFFTFVGPYWEEEYATGERTRLFNDKPVSIKELNEIFEVTVERKANVPGYNFPPVVRKYWIDSRQGFSMIRFDFGGGLDTIEISWEERNQVWVPMSFKLSSTQTTQSAEWKIDWSFVNEDVPEDYFDPTLLSDEVTMLVSKELDQPIVIGRIGKGYDVPGPLMPLPGNNSSPFRYIPMYLGIFMIILCLCKKAYDYWKR